LPGLMRYYSLVGREGVRDAFDWIRRQGFWYGLAFTAMVFVVQCGRSNEPDQLVDAAVTAGEAAVILVTGTILAHVVRAPAKRDETRGARLEALEQALIPSLDLRVGNTEEFNRTQYEGPSEAALSSLSADQRRRYVPRVGWQRYSKLVKVTNLSATEARRASVRITGWEPDPVTGVLPAVLPWFGSENTTADIPPGQFAYVVIAAVSRALKSTFREPPYRDWGSEDGRFPEIVVKLEGWCEGSATVSKWLRLTALEEDWPSVEEIMLAGEHHQPNGGAAPERRPQTGDDADVDL
jgi:hypothetical protein